MSCINHLVVLHGIVRRSQMLLTVISHQTFCCTVLKLHVKGTLSHSNKVKNKIKYYSSDHFQHCFKLMLHFRVWNHNFYSFFLNLSILLCYTDIEISPWCMVNSKARILLRSRRMGWYKAFVQIGSMVLK